MDFFGIGPGELILVGMIALIVFGPGRLPEIAAGAGRAVRELRKVTSEMTSEFTRTMNLDESAAQTSSPATPSSENGYGNSPQQNSDNSMAANNNDEATEATMTKICSSCSHLNPSTNKFCGGCGAPLS